MFVNRNLIPYHHERDWFDPTNQSLKHSLVLLDDEILSRIIRNGAMEDKWRLLGSGQQDVMDWNDPKKFEVKLDVTNFTPEEITVKVKGNDLLVEGKHEEKQDKYGHGYVSRQFTRRYTLPDDVDLEQLSSSFDGQGKTLTIQALKKKIQLDGSERVIPITVEEKEQSKEIGDEDVERWCNQQ